MEKSKIAKNKNEKRKIFGKYDLVSKHVGSLEINEITSPKTSGRYRGTSVGRDKNGFFATTHRARSKSFDSPQKIPDAKLKWIKSTG